MRCRPNEGPEGGWWLDRGKDNKLDLVHLGHECEEKLLGETPDEGGWIEAHLCLEYEANIMGMASLNERLGLRPINQEAGE